MQFYQMLSYLFTKRQKRQFVLIFFLQLVATLLDFVGISLILPFVDLLIDPKAVVGTRWGTVIAGIIGSSEPNDILLFLTLLMIGVYILKNVYLPVLAAIQTRFNFNHHIRMGARMISCYLHKPYTFHLQKNTAELIRNINHDVGGVFGMISSIFSLISDALIILILAVYLLSVDPWMTLAIMLALILCSAVYFLLVRRKIRRLGQENRDLSAQMFQAIGQSMGGIKEVKIMGTEQYFADAYVSAGKKMVRCRQRYAVLAAIPARLTEALCMSTVLTVIAVKILSGDDMAATIPDLSAFAVCAIRLLPRANSINSAVNGITYSLPSVKAVYEELRDFEREKARKAENAEKRAKKDPASDEKQRDIVIRNVSFTYPEKDVPVLKNVNLQIRHGTSVGIVGVTGAGKTTLVDVILGILKPQEGSVRYGALDIHEDYAEWQKHIGYIPQDIYLTDDSIRKNVALGIGEDEIDDEQVWRSLESAQLADFVRSLEKGLDTVVGERGVRISEGQRQRIGIARALYREPEILFLDEATSSLDNETEKAVMVSVNALGGERTMIIVAHRLTTLTGCDKIYCVDENGVHETERKE